MEGLDIFVAVVVFLAIIGLFFLSPLIATIAIAVLLALLMYNFMTTWRTRRV